MSDSKNDQDDLGAGDYRNRLSITTEDYCSMIWLPGSILLISQLNLALRGITRKRVYLRLRLL